MTSSRRCWEDGDEADQAGGAGGLPGCAVRRQSPEAGKRGRDEHDSGGVGAPAGVQGGGGLLRDGCSRSSSPRALGRRGLGEEEAHRRRRRRWWWPWTTARRETAAGDGGPPELAVPVVLRRPGGGCRRRGGGRGDGTRAWRWSREGERRARWIGRRELDASECERVAAQEDGGRGRARVRKGGAAGLLGFSGPAWLDRPKRPAGLLFSPSYSFPFTKKTEKRKKRKRR